MNQLDGDASPVGPGLAPRKPVLVEGSRVRTEAVEINAAWHCNISCRSCAHGSPSMPVDFAVLQQVEADLSRLAQHLVVDHVRVLGGEPLLHPQLPALFSAIRRSGITSTLRVLTNGLLLARQDEAFWHLVDEVHVSVYPNTRRNIERDAPGIIGAARATGTVLVFKEFRNFRLSFRNRDQPELTQAIYSTCQVGNRWRCLTADTGRLYRCPQSALLSRTRPAWRRSDSLVIDEIASHHELRDWVLRPEALDGCQECTGSAGRLHQHETLTPRLARKGDPGSPSDADDPIDRSFLATLVGDPDADNGCVSEEIRWA